MDNNACCQLANHVGLTKPKWILTQCQRFFKGPVNPWRVYQHLDHKTLTDRMGNICGRTVTDLGTHRPKDLYQQWLPITIQQSSKLQPLSTTDVHRPRKNGQNPRHWNSLLFIPFSQHNKALMAQMVLKSSSFTMLTEL